MHTNTTAEVSEEKVTAERVSGWWTRRRRLLGLAGVGAGLAALSLTAIAFGIRATTPHVDVSPLVSLANVTGPGVDSNFADPCYIDDAASGLHYAFATNKFKFNQAGQVHIQLSTSADFAAWNLTGRDVLPHAGNWSSNAFVWSPDVVRLDSGRFVMYYAAQQRRLHCIGAAFADAVDGPYVPQATPLVCPLSQGGALDPEGFRDADGTRYLLYKIDGNTFDRPHRNFSSTPIMLQQLAPDGATFVGAPVTIMDRTPADGLLIEGPALGRYQTTAGEALYVLFFSSHLFTGPGYNVKYALARNVRGPYVRADAPLLKTGMGPHAQLFGPGGIDVGVSSRRFVFHTIKNDTLQPGGHVVRSMWTGTIDINGVSSAFYEGMG